MSNHAEHYNAYLLWKRKALWLILAVIGVCVTTHSFLYYKLIRLQKTLGETQTVEQSIIKNSGLAELESVILQADQQELYTWISALVCTLPALVKMVEITYQDKKLSLTLEASNRELYIRCLELFERHALLKKLRLEKKFMKEQQHCFIMKN